MNLLEQNVTMTLFLAIQFAAAQSLEDFGYRQGRVLVQPRPLDKLHASTDAVT
jgi:hypothetical protein